MGSLRTVTSKRGQSVSELWTPSFSAVGEGETASPYCITDIRWYVMFITRWVTTDETADLCQKAGHVDEQLASLHGSLFKIQCSGKECAYETWNRAPGPTVPGLNMSPSHNIDLTIEYSGLAVASVPDCPLCGKFKLRPGVCWFGEELPRSELVRVEEWFRRTSSVDLVLVVGTERSPFVAEAIAKGAEVAWLNFFEENIQDSGGDWFVETDAPQ